MERGVEIADGIRLIPNLISAIILHYLDGSSLVMYVLKSERGK